MKCIFGHRWETLARGKVRAVYHSLLFGKEWKEDNLGEIQKCSRCGKRRGRIINMNGRVRPVDPEFLSSVV